VIQKTLFGSAEKIIWCKQCRKREAIDGLCCSVCGGVEGKWQDIPKEWRICCENRATGIRQRAQHKRLPFARRSDLRAKLVEQDYRCWFTGEPLLPDATLRLAHLIPAVDGGSFTIENLVWTTDRINKLMGTLNGNEFIDICIKVASIHRKDNA